MIIFDRWDSFFYHIAQDCASMSRCLSRQIGAVIVRDHRIVSTGYNGPPSGILPCNKRHKKDPYLNNLYNESKVSIRNSCPRTLLGASSGEMIELCPAIHAEANALLNAARVGNSTVGAKMYMTCGIPCRNCLGSIINAGISEIICTSLEWYDESSKYLFFLSNLKLRLYDSGPIDKYRLRYGDY